jgi:two-component system cell cycle response regulator CtrA
MQGSDVLRTVRARRNDIPVLVLSGLSGPQAKIKALGLGADDFINKPVDGAELVARLHAIVRRNHGVTQQIHALRRPRAQPGQPRGHRRRAPRRSVGERIRHSRTAAGTPGQGGAQEAFLGHLYSGPSEPDVRIIDVFVCHVRRKLAKAGLPHLITTVNGFGYVVHAPHAAPPARPLAAEGKRNVTLPDAVVAA